MHNDRHSLIFIGLLVLGMSLIPLGDSAGKLLGQAGVEPAFIAWSRLAVGFLFVLPFSALVRCELIQLFSWKLLLRAALFSGAIFSILTALKTEPIANVFGIFFIGPIVSYFLAAILLKEKISLLRTLLLFIGFVGVLIVVKPGFDMSVGSMLALLAGTLYGCLLVTNRWLANQFRPRLILISTLFLGSFLLAPAALPSIPEEVNWNIAGLVLLSSIASALGNLIIIEANKHLEASIVAPFVYSQLIAATLLGYLLFDEWPDHYSLIGLAIIFGSGVLSFIVTNKNTKT